MRYTSELFKKCFKLPLKLLVIIAMSQDNKSQLQHFKVANELVTTEKTYVLYLQKLNEHYIKPLKDNDILNSKTFKVLFPSDLQ